jgi:hypothetical protein
MSDYTCVKAFLSVSGRNYNYGSEISTIVYYNLQPSERRNFIRKSEDDSRSSQESSYSSGDSSWLSTPDSGSSSASWDFGSSSDSSSSDSSSFDFGGGDTGGGGSTGDW